MRQCARSPLLQVMVCSRLAHYNDVIMSAMASQIAGASTVYSTVCSGADHRKHQYSASLAFVRGIHRWPVTRKMFRFDDVIMHWHNQCWFIVNWTPWVKLLWSWNQHEKHSFTTVILKMVSTKWRPFFRPQTVETIKVNGTRENTLTIYSLSLHKIYEWCSFQISLYIGDLEYDTAAQTTLFKMADKISLDVENFRIPEFTKK